MAWDFESVAGPFNPRLTEGPAWDGEALLFTHIPASRILRYDPDDRGLHGVSRKYQSHEWLGLRPGRPSVRLLLRRTVHRAL